jgi:hypothetical protein
MPKRYISAQVFSLLGMDDGVKVQFLTQSEPVSFFLKFKITSQMNNRKSFEHSQTGNTQIQELQNCGQ